MKNFKKGFTLIELLVVVAIIGILASVVLASLSTARSKGKDAAIKSELSSMRSQAEIFYNSNTKYPNSYGNLGIGASYTVCISTFDGSLFKNSTAYDPTIALNALIQAVVNNEPTPPGLLCAAGGGASGGATSWAVSAPLVSNTSTSFCVDSTGFSGSGASNKLIATGGGPGTIAKCCTDVNQTTCDQ